MKMIRRAVAKILVSILCMLASLHASAQINTDRMMVVGRNALYFEDYVLAIQYFNQVIGAKPYLYEPYFYRAIAKLSLEDYKGAENDCNLSVERNPFVVDSYHIRSLSLIYQGRYDDAVKDCYKGLSLDPENLSMRHNLVLCLLKRNELSKANIAIDTILQIYPKYAPAISIRSDIYMEQGDTTLAIEWIDKALNIDPYDAALHHTKGLFLSRQALYEDAEEQFNAAIYLNPNRSQFYINRAMARYYQNNLRGAMSDYDMAINIDPNGAIGYYNRGLLRAQIGDDNRAIEDFDNVIQLEPSNIMAIYNRAILRELTGDLGGAESDISRVLDRYPSFIQGYLLRADIRHRLGDIAGAESDHLIVVREQNRQFNSGSVTEESNEDTGGSDKQKTSDNNILNYRKLVAANEEQYATEFISSYRGKVQNRSVDVQYLPSFYLSYYGITSEIERRSYFSASIEELNRDKILMSALKINPKEIGLTSQQIESLFADIERLTRALQQEQNPLYLLARALDYFLLQDYTSAYSDCSRVIQMDSELWVAYFCRSFILERRLEAESAMGRTIPENANIGFTTYDESQMVIEDLSKSIALNPNFSYAYFNRGTKYAKMSDYHAAIVDFTTAISLNDELAEAYYNRALVLVFLNRYEEAVADLSRAGELGLYTAYNIIKRFSYTD